MCSELSSQPKVGIVILNWNGWDDTNRCLNQLSNLEYPHEVYVIDNGSVDGSGERIKEEYECANVTLLDENRGFAGGCNVGINQALKEGINYILLINNDVRINEDLLPYLVETMKSKEKVAAVSCPLYNQNGEVSFAGGKLRPLLTRADEHEKILSEYPYETEFITGALIMMNSEFLDRFGYLDESYFFGREDMQFSYDAVCNGWSLMIDPRTRAMHKEGSSAGTSTPFRWYHTTRNRLQFAQQLSTPQQIFFMIFFTTTRLIRIVQWLFSGQTETVAATIMGIVDWTLDKPFKKPEWFNAE